MIYMCSETRSKLSSPAVTVFLLSLRLFFKIDYFLKILTLKFEPQKLRKEQTYRSNMKPS
jgi:hypothetical protein